MNSAQHNYDNTRATPPMALNLPSLPLGDKQTSKIKREKTSAFYS
jgi:hypothetical protein